MLKSYRLWTGLVAALAVLLTACSAKNATPVVTPAPAAAAGAFLVEGRVVPVWTQAVGFRTNGVVSEVLVQEGETVTEGQVLARLGNSAPVQAEIARAEQEVLAAQQALDSLHANAPLAVAQAALAEATTQKQLEDARQAVTDLKQAQVDKPVDERPSDTAVAEAEARVTVLEATLAQAQADRQALGTEGLDPEQLQAAQARLTTAQAALASAQANLANLELTAPHAGTVVDLGLKPGQWVNVGQSGLTLADLTWVVETDNLTELEVVHVTEGQAVSLTLDALPGVTFSGQVQQINARYEEKRGDVTYTVTLALGNSDPQVRWGMTAAIQFEP